VPLHCRDAVSARGLNFFPSQARGWRAERRNLVARDPFRDRAGASRRANAAFSGAGPAFAVSVPLRSFVLLGFLSPRPAVERGDRQRLMWTLRSSASSWQGLVMDPGGARRRPECFVANEARRDTAPHPASRRLMRTPLQRTRWVKHKRGLGSGDCLGIALHDFAMAERAGP
jgi:hypothetical protein